MTGKREKRRLHEALRVLMGSYELVDVVDSVDIGEPVVALRARRHERACGGVAAAYYRARG